MWCPGLVDGLAQCESYARAVLALEVGATDEQIEARLKARMERQKRVLGHGAAVVVLVDRSALERMVGSAAVMAEQMAHLIELAELPRVTVQVVPTIAHQATGSELIIADSAAYVEHLQSGAVYSDDERFTRLDTIMDTLRSEALRASESQALIREAYEKWSAK